MRFLAPLVLLVSMLMLYVPFSPEMPVASLDPSWSMGMNELVSRGAVFGRDVIFTFGPLAAVYTTMFHPSTDSTMLLVSVILSLGVTFCWSVLLKNRPAWVWLGVGLSVWIMFNSRDAMLFLLPVLATLATGEWIWSRRGPRQGHPPVHALDVAGLTLIWAGIGLLPLVKGTILVLSLALTVLTCLYAALQGFRLLAAGVLVLPQLITALAWAAAGQPIEYLPSYLQSMSEIVKGYTEAMASWHVTKGHLTQVLPFVVITLLLLRVVWRQGIERGRATAMFFFAAYGMSLFIAYKAAFVRHDEGHAIAASNLLWAMVITAAVRQPMPTWQAVRWVSAAFAVWLTVMIAFPDWTVKSHFAHWSKKQKHAVLGLVDRSAHPDAILKKYEAALAHIRLDHPLPALSGGVDVYSTNQAVVLAHGLSWQPRPVLQSYSAYTPVLARLNEQHLLGASAPDWILFAVEPIDGRMASQEDGDSWAHLLTGYAPVERVRDGLLLHRRNTSDRAPPQTGRVLLERAARLGERIAMPQDAGPLMLSIQAERNILGRLMHTAFKSGSLALDIELATGQVRQLRVVSGMLSDGVLLSPLVETTDEFALLYGDAALLADKQVKSIRLVEINRKPSQWQAGYTLTVRSTRAPGQQHDALMRVVTFQLPHGVEKTDTWVETTCEGSIDSTNTMTEGSTHLHQGALLRARGWVAHRGEHGPELKRPLMALQNAQGQRWTMPVTVEKRPDVGAHLGAPALSDAGWSTIGDLRSLHGAFTLSVGYQDGDVIRTCSNLSMALQRP